MGKILSIIIRLLLAFCVAYISRDSFDSFINRVVVFVGVYSFVSYYIMMYLQCAKWNSEDDQRHFTPYYSNWIFEIVGSLFVQFVLPLIFCLVPLFIMAKLIEWIFPENLEETIQGIVSVVILIYPFIRDICSVVGMFKAKQKARDVSRTQENTRNSIQSNR